MKKIFVCGLLMIPAIFGFGSIGCGGERTGNVNTTNMNREYLSTNGNANSFSSTADPNNNKSDSNANMVNSSNNLARNAAIGEGEFMTEAAVGGMAEVELGKMASTKAQNAEVKKFAQMMVADHTKSNEELKALASSKNVALPAALDAKHQSTMTELQGLSGSAFDRAYVAGQLADHERTVKLFQAQAQNGTDAEVKAFAAKNLPALQMHLEMVRNLNNKMNSGGAGGNTNSGGGGGSTSGSSSNMR